MDLDCLHQNRDFSASSEAIFKISDATCREIDAPCVFGALIVKRFMPTPWNFRGTMFSPVWYNFDPRATQVRTAPHVRVITDYSSQLEAIGNHGSGLGKHSMHSSVGKSCSAPHVSDRAASLAAKCFFRPVNGKRSKANIVTCS